VGLAAAAVVAAERGRGTEDPLVLPWIHERERESSGSGAKDQCDGKESLGDTESDHAQD
jgi:hypothetical protein